MSNRKAVRKKQKEDRYFDGRHFQRSESPSERHRGEEEHIQEQYPSEDEEWQIKPSEHRRDY